MPIVGLGELCVIVLRRELRRFWREETRLEGRLKEMRLLAEVQLEVLIGKEEVMRKMVQRRRV